MEGRGIRIVGAASFSKEELKDFLKKFDVYSSRNHLAVGERERLWTAVQNEIVWLDRGLRLKNQTIQFLKKNLFDAVLEISGPIDVEGGRASFHAELAKKIGRLPLRLGEVYRR